MNEIDLKLKIEGLEKVIQEHKADANRYEDQLRETNKQLVDYNKPELTPAMMDNIYEAIEKAVEQYDFSDQDNYNIEFGIEYDNKVHAENIELQHNNDLIEAIAEKVSKIFTEADAPEDELNKE